METMLDWKSIGSILATFMFLRTALRDFVPPEVYQFLRNFFSRFITAVHPRVTIVIDEFDATFNNELFDAVQCYLSSRCIASANVLRLSKPKNSRSLTFTMDASQRLDDFFAGASLRWSFYSVEGGKSGSGPHHGYVRSGEHRFFELSFHCRHKSLVHARYLPHLMDEAAAIRFRNSERRLYTNRSAEDNGRFWSSVPFHHPSTFDTVALDPGLKEEIRRDLTKFVDQKDYYARVGRAWKRGYLLYGPPGTGKTSLIAAIANFLEFDIYDLELTAVTSNSQLRKLLISTTSKSVIVVEDVDCTLDLSSRKKVGGGGGGEEDHLLKETDEDSGGGGRKGGTYGMVSLSGVLNFVDGLWSSCVGERLMIFTTNHLKKLDPALLRPGRMDKRIHLTYCGVPAFKILARNYLGVDGDAHRVMEEVERLLPQARMTPAEVAEVFMSCEDEAEVGMEMAVAEMKRRRALLLLSHQQHAEAQHMEGTEEE